MTLILRKATEVDLPLLVQMNKQLIVDEGSSNPMDKQQLEYRMKAWMLSGWNIDLIYLDSEIVGYALYQFRDDEVYLRHYFIKSEHRNKGYGQQGIQLLKEKRFKQIGTVTLDVLNHNTMGMSFWKKVGFMPYSTTMKMMGDMSTDE